MLVHSRYLTMTPARQSALACRWRQVGMRCSLRDPPAVNRLLRRLPGGQHPGDRGGLRRRQPGRPQPPVRQGPREGLQGPQVSPCPDLNLDPKPTLTLQSKPILHPLTRPLHACLLLQFRRCASATKHLLRDQACRQLTVKRQSRGIACRARFFWAWSHDKRTCRCPHQVVHSPYPRSYIWWRTWSSYVALTEFSQSRITPYAPIHTLSGAW